MTEKTFLTDNADQVGMLFGAYDANQEMIEKRFGVRLRAKDGVILITGDESAVDAAYATLAGITCVDSIGIVGEWAHSVKEYAVMKSLADSAKYQSAVAAKI